jgi:hypothetical protein
MLVAHFAKLEMQHLDTFHCNYSRKARSQLQPICPNNNMSDEKSHIMKTYLKKQKPIQEERKKF